jgi:hypothetical protein
LVIEQARWLSCKRECSMARERRSRDRPSAAAGAAADATTAHYCFGGAELPTVADAPAAL